MKGFQLIATGGALPGRTVTNEELSRTVDTSDAWITSRTGIRTRHWCTADESAATLAIAAAKQALQRSGLAPADIACCVCATLSAPDATPSVACQVQAALGLPENRPALDVNAACSGFLYGTAVARGLLATLAGQYALVIGCEALSPPDGPRRPLHLRPLRGRAGRPSSGWPTPLCPRWARGSDVLHAGGRTERFQPHHHVDGKAVFRFAVDALPAACNTVLDDRQDAGRGRLEWSVIRPTAASSTTVCGQSRPGQVLQEHGPPQQHQRRQHPGSPETSWPRPGAAAAGAGDRLHRLWRRPDLGRHDREV